MLNEEYPRDAGVALSMLALDTLGVLVAGNAALRPKIGWVSGEGRVVGRGARQWEYAGAEVRCGGGQGLSPLEQGTMTLPAPQLQGANRV